MCPNQNSASEVEFLCFWGNLIQILYSLYLYYDRTDSGVPRSQIESHLHYDSDMQEDFLEILLQHNAFKPRDVERSFVQADRSICFCAMRIRCSAWRTRKGGGSRLHALSIGVGEYQPA